MIMWNGKEYRCPVEVGMDVISGKWKSLILWHLGEGGKRYKELERIVPGVSQKMLTQQLKEMERDGLLIRTVYPEVPPRVEYALTDLGRSGLSILKMLHDWAIDELGCEHPCARGAD
ncbi:winged helix-turn-helix transcriptional regulator [Halodesulfovibrio aestuarii]|uniref:Transcriptional regulator, HxlR family n=1 Tax=Halodesulfovibrio aestuarii TaxID=126333 RepID=A0A8G2CAG5_9BACT|nr:helix-turn-helix domain-containing protein [Halodesulfovibrio aestuarii]SHJ30925.1 transcriptional regulator, HxlR family [Halodesulfovibrio aestuarii]